MTVFLGLGKVAALLFWPLVLANLIDPFANPFGLLLNAAGAVLFFIHLLELAWFGVRLKGRPRVALECLQVLVFGIFHLGLRRPSAKEAGHA